MTKKDITISDDDRTRFYEVMNTDSLSWEEFWAKWDDEEVKLMIFHGG